MQIMAANKKYAVAAPAAYTPDAVLFDGTNDYMTRSSTLSGSPSDSKFLTMSLWIYPLTLPAGGATLYDFRTSSTNRCQSQTYSGNCNLFLYDTGVIGVNKNWNSGLVTGQWQHILIAADMDDIDKCQMWVDDVEITSFTVYTTTSGRSYRWSQYNACTWNHSAAGTEQSHAHFAEAWITNTYIDFNTESNRRKFITATGKPVDLGSDGSTPTGTAPLVYFKGDAATWNAGTNAGSGGNYTMTGAVTDSGVEPVEL